MQALCLTKADAAFERGAPVKAKQAEALRTLTESLGERGALLVTGTLTPSSKGVRAKPGPGKRTWVDGPFAESKELIAGFSILDVPTLKDAIAWAERYATISSSGEVDVRELSDD